MKSLTCSEILSAVHGRWLRRGEDRLVDTVTTDTRAATEGSLFIALRGERFDGHEFLPAAADAGCVAAIVRRDAEPRPDVAERFPAGVIGVADTARALTDLAAYHRGLTAADVIAVTGSNGKTTVKRMIHHILSRRLTGTCSPKSLNNHLGVPLTLLGVGGGDDYVVCELGTSAPGEIAALAALARPRIAVITSVSPAHLAGFGSVDRVAVEKASLLGELADDGLAVVDGDSYVLGRVLRYHRKRMIRFGESDACELRLTDYRPRGRGQEFTVNGHLSVRLPIPGRHNALNAMAAIAVAQRMGLSQAEAAEALADLPAVSMRLQWLDAGGVTILNDAYNANPASVAAAADTLADAEGTRRVIVLGDMRELGPTERDLHLQAGRDVARRNVDLVVGVGALGKYIAAGAAETLAAAETFASTAEAARGLPALLAEGDVVLLKGSRAMGMETLIDPVRRAFAPHKELDR